MTKSQIKKYECVYCLHGDKRDEGRLRKDFCKLSKQHLLELEFCPLVSRKLKSKDNSKIAVA